MRNHKGRFAAVTRLASLWPRFERPVHRDRAHVLERPGDLEDAKVVAAVADDLDADRQAACIETHVDRAGGLPRLVEGRRKNGVASGMARSGPGSSAGKFTIGSVGAIR